MLNDTPNHHNDNMSQVRKSIASRPPSMSKHFATDAQMQAHAPITLRDLNAGISEYFHRMSCDFNEFFEQGDKA